MSAGTGFFVTADGYLVTCEHVISRGYFLSCQIRHKLVSGGTRQEEQDN